MNIDYKRIKLSDDNDAYGLHLTDGTNVDYDVIVASFGDIMVAESYGDYQGDSMYMIRRGARFGMVRVGWGSCSGCDALEACHNQGI